MTDQEIDAVCRKIAEDMAAAGLGWHEDALRRFVRPPIFTIAERAEAWAMLRQYVADRCRRIAGTRRRQKRRARKARRR